MVDSEFQGVDAGAAVGVVIGVGVSARCGVCRAVPGETLASSLRFDIVRTIIDGEFQGVHALTTRIVGVSVGVRT